jgi:hypothetical protein
VRINEKRRDEHVFGSFKEASFVWP